jgi:endonuclease YncB( thermonuclease family)
MWPAIYNSLLALAFALLAWVSVPVPARVANPDSFEAEVVGVIDGDTIDVRAGNTPSYRIRLAGIDAPEKKQAFGNKAKQNLSDLVYRKAVRIEWSKKDKYGRIVAKILAPPGSCATQPCKATFDVNLAQIAAGYAWHYKEYEKEQPKQDRQAYDLAEQHAREQGLGLWKDAHPVPPWEWRHPSEVTSTDGPVKKSRNNICHDPSMSTYGSVLKFTSFPTLDACIASGGRLPKSAGG